VPEGAHSRHRRNVPMGHDVKARLWILYVVGALATVGGYYASGQTVWIFHLIGLSAAVGIIAGVAIHKPEHKLPWILFALTLVAVFFVGEVAGTTASSCRSASAFNLV